MQRENEEGQHNDEAANLRVKLFMFLLVCNGIYEDIDHSNMSNDPRRLQDDQKSNRCTLVDSDHVDSDHIDSDDIRKNHGKVIDVDVGGGGDDAAASGDDDDDDDNDDDEEEEEQEEEAEEAGRREEGKKGRREEGKKGRGAQQGGSQP